MDPRNLNENFFWQQNTSEDKIKFLLRYAILAPSTHNTQPWLFKITEDVCEIYYDKKYVLIEADSKKRDLYISMGCLIENLIIAANFFNVFGSLKINESLFSNHIATFKLSKIIPERFNENYTSLLKAILKRSNARGLFYPCSNCFQVCEEVKKSIPTEYIKEVSIDFISDDSKIKKISNLTAEGLQIAYKNKSFRREMSKWMKNSLTKKREGIPGYALKMPLLLSFILPTLVRYVDIGKFLAKLNKKSLSSAPIVAVLSSSINNPSVWIDIGRVSERIMLEINVRNLNTSIFVASIEMGNLHTKLKEIINTDKEPQFLFAIGKLDLPKKLTPRHNLEEKII